MSSDSIETQRAIEQGLLKREEVFRQILDALADMVLVKGAHSRLVWGNRAFRDYYGMSNEQLQQLVDAPFNAPDHTLRYVADDLQVFTTGQTLEIPVEPVTRHDGVVNLFNTVKTAIRDESGRVRLTVGVSRNIAETVELRALLLTARQQLDRDRLSAFAAQLPGFLFQLRLAGTDHAFTFVSSRVSAYYGVSPAELLADAEVLFRNMDAEQSRVELRDAFASAAATLDPVEHLHRVKGAEGLRWMELLARPTREADGSVTFHGYVQDVTSRHVVELERENLIARLKERNHEMEQFTYTISHDLKSPLVTIRGFLSGIEDDIRAGKTERALTDLGRVRGAAEKMSRMLAELLELSRVGRVGQGRTEFELGSVIAEAKELLAARLSSANVTCEVEGGALRVVAERTRLVQVFQNLIENAVKYRGQQQAPHLRIVCREAEGRVEVSVSDNGMGIDPVHHQRIFGLFDKLDPASEGTGVGLALVKTIVETHQGRVWVESAGVGSGSTFFVSLPRR